MSELQDVNDWVTFGLYLGIKMSRIEAIKVDCPTLGDRRTQMLNEWQKKVTPTWSAVVQALVGIGMRSLASELAQKYGWWLIGMIYTVLLKYINFLPTSGVSAPKLSDEEPLEQLKNIPQQKEVCEG